MTPLPSYEAIEEILEELRPGMWYESADIQVIELKREGGQWRLRFASQNLSAENEAEIEAVLKARFPDLLVIFIIDPNDGGSAPVFV